MLPFVKTEALGNDFILIEEPLATGDHAWLARKMCNRRLGVGADGLLLWTRVRDSFRVRIFNMDGSEAECSGNGLRCLAAYLFQSKQIHADSVSLRTVSGIYTLTRVGELYSADMGTPEFAPERIPFETAETLERVVDYPLDVDGIECRITACSTGNPHCSLFVDTIDSETVETLGPKLESHPAFPNRTNVEFIRILNQGEIEVAFWERGAGRTPASGTGSCGATVASVLNGLTDRSVYIHTTHGTIQVEWAQDGKLTLTASATVVAEGHYFGSLKP